MRPHLQRLHLFAWVMMCGLLSAQLPLRFEHLGNAQGVGFGMHLRRGGDANGDGFPDYLLVIPVESSFANANGAIQVHSGQDGSLIHILMTPNPANPPSQNLGAACDAGDVDQDSHDDILGYSTGLSGGSLLLFSGATGNVILSTPNLGLVGPTVYILDTVKDLNGDGVREVVLLNRNPWKLRILSGSDHSVLLLVDFSTTGFYPQIVRNAGDVNGDGIDDLVLGSPFYPYSHAIQPPTGPPTTGAVAILSSLDGSVIHSLLGPPPTTGILGSFVFSQFGYTVDGLGDLNGDGFDDFAIGAPGDGYGSIRIHSGFDASLMGTLIGATTLDAFATSLSRCGDVNGDGVPDLAAGAPNWTPPGAIGGLNGAYGLMLVFSGVDFSLLFSQEGTYQLALGVSIMGLGDLNGDGFPDVGCSMADSSIAINNGGVRVYSFAGTRRYGENLGGLQTLNQTWFPAVAGDPAQGAIVCSGGVPGGLGFFGLSLATANTSVMGVPVVIDDSPQELILTQPFLFDGQGKYAALAPIRHPVFGGALVRSQFFDLTPPFASSNGLEFLLLP